MPDAENELCYRGRTCTVRYDSEAGCYFGTVELDGASRRFGGNSAEETLGQLFRIVDADQRAHFEPVRTAAPPPSHGESILAAILSLVSLAVLLMALLGLLD